ncbi:DUF2264 domain-containing protein [Paenibacillus koleovorans]|uniref:DUF2264 domain-containing protein n=1 Tax=Paenibacillus koleovorans TaxID=121608 RepID=UPI000FDA7BC4|nr:DUF2264 domain-containing protein [Paenibacillus koleovorans]
MEQKKQVKQGAADRQYWLSTLRRIAEPVLTTLDSRTLKARMPIEKRPESLDRHMFTYLEALGRLLAGIAPWLEHGPDQGEEGALRSRYAELARSAIDAGTDPSSPDYMNFSEGNQPIVDAAFLSHAVLRAPNELWEKLDTRVKRNLVQALKATRTRKPGFNNWLLFAATIETALYRMGEPDWDRMRIDFALKQHEQWYLGDGMYGDGVEFHADYYNSFVIQPMLIDVLETVGNLETWDWQPMIERVLKRTKRYADIQERSISPEGTFPVVGRSIAYRFGAFQLLSQVALRRELPEHIAPAQARGALTAIIRRSIEMPGTFDANGWLQIGLAGHQPELGESYISTGSLYLCATVFLALGLPADDPFWQGDADWTSKTVWGGGHATIDTALRSK